MRCLDVQVAVVGAGPGGLAAAEVFTSPALPLPGTLLLDDAPAPGGQIWRGNALDLPDHVRYLPQTQIVDCVPRADGPPVLLATTPDGAVRITAQAVILATGAMERFLPFPGWTLPGVVGAGGLQALIKGGFDVAGRRVVVAGSGPLLLAVADLARRRGARVVCVTEQARRRSLLPFGRAVLARPGKLLQGVGLAWRLLGTPKRFGCWPVEARGDGRVEQVVLRTSNGSDRTVDLDLDCDLLACGFGIVPRVALPRLLGCEVAPGPDGALRVAVDERQTTSVPGVFAVGEATGVGGVDKAIAEGRIAGLAASGVEPNGRDLARRDRELRFADALATSFVLREELRELPAGDTLVCRCEDVPWSEVSGAASSRDAKLTSRCGMGPCQARVCGPALAYLKGWPPESPRPPLFPTDLQTLTELYGADDD